MSEQHGKIGQRRARRGLLGSAPWGQGRRPGPSKVRARRWASVAVAAGAALATAACQGPGSTRVGMSASSSTAHLSWSKTSTGLPSAGASLTLSDVSAPAYGALWMAAGSSNVTGVSTPQVWTSTDATTWSPAVLPGATTGHAAAATENGTTEVAVGSTGTGSDTRAAVWINQDAHGWSMESNPITSSSSSSSTTTSTSSTTTMATGIPLSRASSLDYLVAGGPGFVAVGTVDGAYQMWTSSDGRTWLPATSFDGKGSGLSSLEINGIYASAQGVYAYGSSLFGSNRKAIAWGSKTGLSWGRLGPGGAPFGGPGGAELSGFVTTEGGNVVAVGAQQLGQQWVPTSWFGLGFSTWGVPLEDFPASVTTPTAVGGGSWLRAVSRTYGSSLVAVGGNATRQQVWTSAGGQTWRQLPLPSRFANSASWQADLVATTSNATVVADSRSGQGLMLVHSSSGWHEVTGLSSSSPVNAAVGLVAFRGRLWLIDNQTSELSASGDRDEQIRVLWTRNGTVWRTAAAFPGRADAVSAEGGSLAITGTVDPKGGSTDPLPGVTEGATWTSTNGSTWKPHPVGASSPVYAITAVGASGLVAGSQSSEGSTGVAYGWLYPAAVSLTSGTALQADPIVGGQLPIDSCSDGRTLVVVGAASRVGPRAGTKPSLNAGISEATEPHAGTANGSDGDPSQGTLAAAWVSTDGGSKWSQSTVSPIDGQGADSYIEGCTFSGGHWLAWGQASGLSGTYPATWTSTNGSAWTQSTGELPAGGGFTSMASTGHELIGVSGAPPLALQDPAYPLDSQASPGLAVQVQALATTAVPSLGVWISTDGGTSWKDLPTDSSTWAGNQYSAATAVAVWHNRVVVAGTVDGSLSAWSAKLS